MRTPPGKNHAGTTGTATVPVELRPAAGLKASKRPGGQGRGRLPARAGRASEVRGAGRRPARHAQHRHRDQRRRRGRVGEAGCMAVQRNSMTRANGSVPSFQPAPPTASDSRTACSRSLTSALASTCTGMGFCPRFRTSKGGSHSRALCRSRAWCGQCGRRLSQLVREEVAVALSEVGQGRFQRAPHTNYAGRSPHHPCSVTRRGLPDREGRRSGRGALGAVVAEVPPQD